MSLLTRMINVYNVDFGISTSPQIAGRIIDSFAVYKTLIEGNPTNYTRGEFLSAVYIGLGSAEYWYDNHGLPGGAEDGPMNFILAADCIGYLAAWGNAWWQDQGPEYSNSWEAQTQRIGSGLIGAAATSTLRGKWFQRKGK